MEYDLSGFADVASADSLAIPKKIGLPVESCTVRWSPDEDTEYWPAGKALSEIRKLNGTLTVIFDWAWVGVTADASVAKRNIDFMNVFKKVDANWSACFFIVFLLGASKRRPCDGRVLPELALNLALVTSAEQWIGE